MFIYYVIKVVSLDLSFWQEEENFKSILIIVLLSFVLIITTLNVKFIHALDGKLVDISSNSSFVNFYWITSNPLLVDKTTAFAAAEQNMMSLSCSDLT
jgi:hypothetical protein